MLSYFPLYRRKVYYELGARRRSASSEQSFNAEEHKKNRQPVKRMREATKSITKEKKAFVVMCTCVTGLKKNAMANKTTSERIVEKYTENDEEEG